MLMMICVTTLGRQHRQMEVLGEGEGNLNDE